jgi:transposase
MKKDAQSHEHIQMMAMGELAHLVRAKPPSTRGQFDNRRQVAGFLGLATSPHDSGAVERSQGISRAGSGPVRATMLQAAWLWIKHQPKSALSRWFLERTQGQSGRIRKIMIVAVARKLAIALWRYLEHGLVPQGAILTNKC